MLSKNSPNSKRFHEILGSVKDEIDRLKSEVRSLEEQNKALRDELENVKEREADTFSSVKETDRMALKHQIRGLITKIDEHLDNQP